MDIVRVTRKLTAKAVLEAYREGIFPMAAPEYGLVTWHRPDPRAIIPLDGFHISHSLRRVLHQRRYTVTLDGDFEATMRACAQGRGDTWITEEFIRVYGELHRQGQAHSLEIHVDGTLAGGVYGVQLARAFFAESMFHRVTNMSKVALAHLVEHLNRTGVTLLDVQYLTPHLASLGAIEIPHAEYRRRLADSLR
ncbi:MAG: leucyl/phenylalanyl-tRNA--protein transferase [Bryobacteraceae bacterium]|nr:leucyl/phenylalanyl-tRNA--protein transferase [Bryobacteraceae bacterium]